MYLKFHYLLQHILCIAMKTICHPIYYENGFVATHALVHMKYGYTLLIPMNQR